MILESIGKIHDLPSDLRQEGNHHKKSIRKGGSKGLSFSRGPKGDPEQLRQPDAAKHHE